MGRKHRGKRTSNFSISHSVFRRIVLQTCKNQGMFGKGLIWDWIWKDIHNSNGLVSIGRFEAAVFPNVGLWFTYIYKTKRTFLTAKGGPRINPLTKDLEKEGPLKTLWEKEKMLETSIFSFFHNFFYHSEDKFNHFNLHLIFHALLLLMLTSLKFCYPERSKGLYKQRIRLLDFWLRW